MYGVIPKRENFESGYSTLIIPIFQGWICSCLDSVFSHMDCKHCLAVSLSIKIRNEAKERSKLVIEQVTCNKCPKCQSANMAKHGIRHNKRYDLQGYSCKDYNNRFSFNLGFEKMKVNPKVITSAMQL